MITGEICIKIWSNAAYMLPFWPCVLSPMTYQEVSLTKTNRQTRIKPQWMKFNQVNPYQHHFHSRIKWVWIIRMAICYYFSWLRIYLKSFLIAVGHYIPLRKNLGIYLCQTHLAYRTTSCLVTYKRYSYTLITIFISSHIAMAWGFQSPDWIQSQQLKFSLPFLL